MPYCDEGIVIRFNLWFDSVSSTSFGHLLARGLGSQTTLSIVACKKRWRAFVALDHLANYRPRCKRKAFCHALWVLRLPCALCANNWCSVYSHIDLFHCSGVKQATAAMRFGVARIMALPCIG